jgi:hypothetical protein
MLFHYIYYFNSSKKHKQVSIVFNFQKNHVVCFHNVFQRFHLAYRPQRNRSSMTRQDNSTVIWLTIWLTTYSILWSHKGSCAESIPNCEIINNCISITMAINGSIYYIYTVVNSSLNTVSVSWEPVDSKSPISCNFHQSILSNILPINVSVLDVFLLVG